MKLFRLNRVFKRRSQRGFDVVLEHSFFGECRFLSVVERIEAAIAMVVAGNPDAIRLPRQNIFEIARLSIAEFA